MADIMAKKTNAKKWKAANERIMTSKNDAQQPQIRSSGSRPHPAVNFDNVPWSQSKIGVMWKLRGETVSVFTPKK